MEPDVELMWLKPDDKDLLLKEEGTEIEFWFFLLCKDCISRRGSLAWLVCACLLKPSTMGCLYYLGCSRTWIHTDSGFEWPPKVFSSRRDKEERRVVPRVIWHGCLQVALRSQVLPLWWTVWSTSDSGQQWTNMEQFQYAFGSPLHLFLLHHHSHHHHHTERRQPEWFQRHRTGTAPSLRRIGVGIVPHGQQ